MAQIRFALARLVECLEATKDQPNVAASGMLFDKAYWPNGKIVNKNGLTKAQCMKQGKPFWPDHNQMDKSNLPTTFSLVGDHGVYIMPNKQWSEEDMKKTPEERYVVYAEGGNPNIDDDYYEFKERVFGGDDGSITISDEWIKTAHENGDEFLTVELTPSRVTLISKSK